MIFEEIKKVICEQLEVEPEEVTMDTTFEDLGADSLDLFQVVIEIEERYRVSYISRWDGLDCRCIFSSSCK